MTFGGVPIFDWLILVVLIGFGIEAYVTTRDKDGDKKVDAESAAVERPSESQTQNKSDL